MMKDREKDLKDRGRERDRKNKKDYIKRKVLVKKMRKF